MLVIYAVPSNASRRIEVRPPPPQVPQSNAICQSLVDQVAELRRPAPEALVPDGRDGSDPCLVLQPSQVHTRASCRFFEREIDPACIDWIILTHIRIRVPTFTCVKTVPRASGGGTTWGYLVPSGHTYNHVVRPGTAWYIEVALGTTWYVMASR